MAERVVKVVLSAKIDEYKRGMVEAANATRAVGTEGQKLAQTRDAMNTLGRAGVAAGALLAAGIGVAIAKYAEFDQAMSYVIATGEDAAANQDALRQAALDAGAATVFSATESANAVEELAKAGLTAADILAGGLTGSLDLAAAGGLGVAEAAGIAATTLQQFQLAGEDASHVADLLAAGAGKAQGDVRDMSAALNQSGLVAAQFGLSVEETVGSLAAFANAGLLGSDAGTSFRQMLLRLGNPTDEAKDLMAELGIEVYNAQGQFIGMSALAGELQSSLGNLSDEQRNTALATIFGADAIRSANILYREGASGIKDWTQQVDDQGFAAEQAATRLDNLAGDVEKLTGALDTAFISMGAGADGPLRALVQGLTSLVDGFNGLPDWAQQGALALGGLLAAVGLVGGAFLLAIPKIAEFKIAMSTLGVTAASTRAGLGSMVGFLGGPWGIALAAAAAAIGAFVIAQANMAAGASELRDTLDDTSGAVTDYTRKVVAKKLAEADAFGQLDKIGVSQKELVDTILEGGDAFDTLTGKMSDFNNNNAFDSGFGNATNTVRELGAQLEIAADSHEDITAATEGSTAASEDSLTATGAQTDALAGLGEVADETADDVNQLEDAIKNFGTAQFDTERAVITFQQSLADLDGALAEGAGSLDVTTKAGRNTLGAMLEVAQSTNDYAASVAAMGGSTAEVQGILEAGRQKIIDTRIALGDTEDQARAYADQLVATPSAVQTAVQLTGVQEAENALARITRERQVNIAANVVGGSEADRVDRVSANGNMIAYANGGFPTGIYKGGPPIHKFAEPETGWEAYISGRPGQEQRNIGIWAEAGRRLGATEFANGGMTGTVGLAPAPVYVQNPFTGEYLLAKVDGRTVSTVQRATIPYRGGRRR